MNGFELVVRENGYILCLLHGTYIRSYVNWTEYFNNCNELMYTLPIRVKKG